MSFSKFVKHELRPEPWQLPQRSQAGIPGRARAPGSHSWNPGLRRHHHRPARSGLCDDEDYGCGVLGWRLDEKDEESETLVAQLTCCCCAFLDFCHHLFLHRAGPCHGLVHCGCSGLVRCAHCALAPFPFSLSSPFSPLAVHDLPFAPPSAPLFAPFSLSFSWEVDPLEAAADVISFPCRVFSKLRHQRSQTGRGQHCLQYPLCLWLEHRTRWADSQF